MLHVLFPGLFTVMKQMRRTQMLTCTSPLHLHIKTWRLKASPCFGSSSLICPALVANLRPLQRLVLWAYKIYSNRVVHVTRLKICISFLQETEPKLSPSWNPKIICDPHPQFTEPICSSTPSEPTQIGSLGGKIELSLTLKNNLAMPGAKVKKKKIPQTGVDFVRGVSWHTESLVKFLLCILVFGLTVK